MADVFGHTDKRFETLRKAFAEQLDSGNELGASLLVDIDGSTVVDIWGGWRDTDRHTPWTTDTLVNLWSTSKTVTNLAALVLVDRGLLELHAPVATYWPEFAANGKERIEVRHVLSHTSGVSGWEAPFSLEDMYDQKRSAEQLASQAPWWDPGTASGYHSSNQGHLVGELVRRVTGRSLKSFIAEDIAAPLGADFQLGAIEADWGRIAPIVPPTSIPLDFGSLDPEGVTYKTLLVPQIDPLVANSAAWRHAALGAANGHGNARSVARILSAITLGGTVDGVRLLSPETISAIFDEQSHGPDLVLGVPIRFGVGYALPEDVTVPYIPRGRTCYWGGWGGSLNIMDLDRRITISYVMNKMAPGIIGSDRSEAYVNALEECLN